MLAENQTFYIIFVDTIKNAVLKNAMDYVLHLVMLYLVVSLVLNG